MKFPTAECPLCGEILIIKMNCGVTAYSCPAGIETHYEVEEDEKDAIQHIYAFPYAIDNYASSDRTRLFLWRDGRWRFTKNVSRIEPRPLDKLMDILIDILPLEDFFL